MPFFTVLVFPYDDYSKMFTHHAVKEGIVQSFMILEKLPACLTKGLSLLLQFKYQCRLDCGNS